MTTPSADPFAGYGRPHVEGRGYDPPTVPPADVDGATGRRRHSQLADDVAVTRTVQSRQECYLDRPIFEPVRDDAG